MNNTDCVRWLDFWNRVRTQTYADHYDPLICVPPPLEISPTPTVYKAEEMRLILLTHLNVQIAKILNQIWS